MIYMDRTIDSDGKRIADHYGEEIEGNQLIEEMAELIQAINKHRRYRDQVTMYHLHEETADVLATLERYAYLVGIDDSIVQQIIGEKNARELRRIHEDK